MSKITEILGNAQKRGAEAKLPYGGALRPEEAWALMESAPGAKLIDVRTRAELDWVGRIPGAVEIEWATYPGMQANPHFLAQLEQQVDKEALALFICRSGVRGHNAATVAAQAGYTNCYNILEGFEGDKNVHEHRNTTNGWRKAGLPWKQS